MEHYVLLVSCEAMDKLTKENEAALVFTGGFDTSSKFGDIAQAASFVCVMYPMANYEELAQRIGTIDIINSK
jgi:predicted transcriptional regulator